MKSQQQEKSIEIMAKYLKKSFHIEKSLPGQGPMEAPWENKSSAQEKNS